MDVMTLPREPIAMSEPPAVATCEEELVAAAQRGDVDAAEQLARLSYQGIFSSLERLCGGDRELAADLCQETYRRAWTSIASFRRGSKFGTWLYRIGYNAFLNHQRSAQRTQPLGTKAMLEIVDPERGPESRASHRWTTARVRSKVIQLPDRLRFLVTAFYWAEIPVSELASAEGVTTVAIRKRLKKALGALRVSLEEEA